MTPDRPNRQHPSRRAPWALAGSHGAMGIRRHDADVGGERIRPRSAVQRYRSRWPRTPKPWATTRSGFPTTSSCRRRPAREISAASGRCFHCWRGVAAVTSRITLGHAGDLPWLAQPGHRGQDGRDDRRDQRRPLCSRRRRRLARARIRNVRLPVGSPGFAVRGCHPDHQPAAAGGIVPTMRALLASNPCGQLRLVVHVRRRAGHRSSLAPTDPGWCGSWPGSATPGTRTGTQTRWPKRCRTSQAS